MAIYIQGHRTIGADETLELSGPVGIYLDQSSAHKSPQLINYGVIELSFDSSEYAVIGIRASFYTGGDGIFWNEAGAVYSVNALHDHGYAYGFMLEQNDCEIRNDGDFLITSGGGAAGVYAGSDNFSFVNTGSFVVQGVDDVEGLVGAGAFDNSGLFDVRSDTGSAWGLVVSIPDVVAINSGQIRVVDHDGVETGAAVFFSPQSEPLEFQNTGTIIASDYAFRELGDSFYTGDARQYVTNSGYVRGDVDLGAADDRFHNSGAVRGDIYLRSGDDLYDGGGRLAGTLSGGSGDDTLIGGRGADHIFGDNPYPVPSDGADVIDGGAGADVLSGGGGADSFVFSSVKHTSADHPDLVIDLEAADLIDLSRIDADVTAGGNQAFHLVGALDGHAGQAALVYDAGADRTRLELDVDGDGSADAVVLFAGAHADFTNFVL
jgi:Ca2+-binding RTX toxin-like protein